MNMNSVRVARGHSVQLSGNRMVGEGQMLPEDHGLSEAEIVKLRSDGFLQRASTSVHYTRGEQVRSPQKWNRDPRRLEDKSLDELNVMIAEIDPKQPLADSVEAAINQLSYQFDEEVDGPYQDENRGGRAVSLIQGGKDDSKDQTAANEEA